MPKKPVLPQFDSNIYLPRTLNELVVYTVYHLHKQGAEISASDDIVSACFLLFPKRFSLQKYPQWPDSAVVSRRFSDCKSKGYLRGNTAQGFRITPKGIKFAEKTEKLLGKTIQAMPALPSKVAKKKSVAATTKTKTKKRAIASIPKVETKKPFVTKTKVKVKKKPSIPIVKAETKKPVVAMTKVKAKKRPSTTPATKTDIKKVVVPEARIETPTPVVSVPVVHPELKARAGKYVHSIQSSDAYKHYKKRMPLNEFDFRSLLLCTMESPPETLARNLVQFKEYVDICERKDLSTFLAFCEENFSHMLVVPGKKTKKARK